MLTAQSLAHRRVLLVISGGIAAYKSLDLIRRLREEGASVPCVLTAGGARFVTPLSVEALSEEPVGTDLWTLNGDSRMSHIRLPREADLILVAPASANLIARMAQGLADDLASTLLLAAAQPVMIAPAMNGAMWAHPAVQANIALLRQRGVIIVGPACGTMACGETGEGRMSEPADILAAVNAHFAKPGLLSGLRALVTSGPTYEPIDPVRFIGNRSSGKQGHAIAEALRDLGADVVLVSGPVSLADPAGLRVVHVQTADEMLAACEAALPVDIAVCAAAVADWRARTIAPDKIKKSGAPPAVELAENPDILASLAARADQRPRLVVGFAAETSAVNEHAAAKLARKKCDWLLANEVGPSSGFATDDNQVTLVRYGAGHGLVTDPWPRQSKRDIAHKLAAAIADHVRTYPERT